MRVEYKWVRINLDQMKGYERSRRTPMVIVFHAFNWYIWDREECWYAWDIVWKFDTKEERDEMLLWLDGIIWVKNV